MPPVRYTLDCRDFVLLTPTLRAYCTEILQILLDAMSQLFFSLSVSMGIMITYGSYVKPDVDLNKAVNQIEIFDTGVAFLAGAMIIPAVFVFSGTEGMGAGPSLMFVSLPKVFAAMGKAGIFVGILFFVTAIFATLSSCISVLESITANCMEIFHTSRKKTVLVLSVIYLAASAVIALGYSIFYVEVKLPNGSVGQLLDIMDYISNSVMMPFIALLSTILIGWVMTPDYVIDEMERNGSRFRRKKTLSYHDPLCCADYDVYPVFTVNRSSLISKKLNITNKKRNLFSWKSFEINTSKNRFLFSEPHMTEVTCFQTL